MLRSLLRPAALATHVLVLAVVVTCVALGQWQLRRLDEVRANNARLEQRLTADRVELADLVAAGAPDAEALEYRRVTATGVFRPDQEVLQRNQQDARGRQGFHLLTPFELEGSDAVVLVRRGWVPTTMDTPPVAEAAPPEGSVTVTGLLERPVPQPGFGARDPDDGHLERVFHADTARLDRQVDGSLYPMVLRLDVPDAAPGAVPAPIGQPELDENNHLSYAVQWHSFALIALITYALWLRSRLPRTRHHVGPDRDREPVLPERPTSGAAS